MNLRKKADKLEEYAEMEGTEFGEACSLLAKIAKYEDYLSEEFAKALEKEIDDHLKNFSENTTILEVDETFTRKVRILEWNS